MTFTCWVYDLSAALGTGVEASPSGHAVGHRLRHEEERLARRREDLRPVALRPAAPLLYSAQRDPRAAAHLALLQPVGEGSRTGGEQDRRAVDGGGEPYVQEKLHRKKYFYPLVPQLQDAPPSVRELLLISRRRMALCARLERQLLTGLEKHALLQNQAGLQTDLPPRTRLKALRIVVPSVRILSDWKSSEIFSPLTTVLSNKPGTDRVLALRTPDLFGYTWPSDPAR